MSATHIGEGAVLLDFALSFLMATALYNTPPRGFFLRTFFNWFMVLGFLITVGVIALHFFGVLS